MCFILLLHRVLPDYPAALVANRDEAWDRPSEAPRRWPSERGGAAFVAPRDLRAGGTWLGVNTNGLVLAVTNRPAGTPDSERRSRGRLATDLLRSRSLDAAISQLRDPRHATRYNPFNLLLVDRHRAVAMTVDRDISIHELSPGLHILTNLGDVDTELLEEVTNAHDPLARVANAAESRWRDPLLEIAADRTTLGASGQPICKQFAERGTVSTSLIGIPARGFENSVFSYADDAPLPSRFVEYDSLLRGLAET